MSSSPTFLSNVRNLPVRLQNGDGTTYKSLGINPPSAGSRIKALHITSDDTVTRVLQFAVTIGGVDYPLGEVSVPNGSGTDGSSPSVSGLNRTKMPALQNDGISVWFDLAQNSDLKVRSEVAVTASKTITVLAEAGDFT